uniref:Uncharacterized protein n=1 Tax=Oryza punctata TaxID=4537 RepID=A0A0E0MH36_ORYPU
MIENQAPILSSFVKYKNRSVAAALQDHDWVATGQYQRGVILARDPYAKDSILWSASANGDFSVKSVYSLLCAR